MPQRGDNRAEGAVTESRQREREREGSWQHMITLGIQSLINWSVHNYAGDNIWEYNKARLWSHLVLEDTGGPVRGQRRPNLGDFASNSGEKSVASESSIIR